ncbi:MAG TPA: ABC transporter permease [Candidatus Bipolaricaulis sp.]|mgnify:FL=1|nr:ABC transporter permease [Candidatus Bipolaricaulis sp.]HRS14413.1 ABC transporter permease [Candidatus Bipolaricaulis sp.]HRU21231.1 ABC transporter permease [Candidatus Bipolaricaulis sp.]
MTGFRQLLRTQALVFLRDKIALFFILLFPVVFILIFGFVWGGSEGGGKVTLGLLVVGERDALLDEVLSSQGTVTVRQYEDRAELEADLAQQVLGLGLVWDGEELLFLQDPTRVQEGYALAEVAQGIAAELDLRRQGLAPVIQVERVSVGRTPAGWFTLVVPGIMAFSVLMSGLLAVSGRITQMKERRLLDRLLVTPMSPTALLGAIGLVRLGVGFVSTTITLGLAVVLFRVQFEVNWGLYTVFVVAATSGAMGLGTLIALVVRRPTSASTVANILAQIMLFLSGVYFPLEIMPAFLRAVGRVVPLTYMVEGMRYVTGVADMSTSRFALVTAGLLGVGLGLFPALSRYVVRVGRR